MAKFKFTVKFDFFFFEVEIKRGFTEQIWGSNTPMPIQGFYLHGKYPIVLGRFGVRVLQYKIDMHFKKYKVVLTPQMPIKFLLCTAVQYKFNQVKYSAVLITTTHEQHLWHHQVLRRSPMVVEPHRGDLRSHVCSNSRTQEGHCSVLLFFAFHVFSGRPCRASLYRTIAL